MVPAVTACQPSPALSLYHGTVSWLALSDRPQGRGMCPQLFLDWLLVGLFCCALALCQMILLEAGPESFHIHHGECLVWERWGCDMSVCE